MRKIAEVFRLSFKMQIIWRFDVAMTMLATISRIFAAWIVWNAIFQGKEMVAGFTLQTMLTYYIVSSFLSSLDMSPQVSWEISDLIRAGRFSGHMVVPINPLVFFGSMVAGESAFHMAFSLIAAAVCSMLFGVRLTLATEAALVLPALLLVILGLGFMVCLHFLIGISALKYPAVQTPLRVSESLILFATGAMVPLALLPEGVQAVLRALPFYYVTYLPTMLLMGQRKSEAWQGVLLLLCWTAAIFALGQWAYNRFRIKYDGVGI